MLKDILGLGILIIVLWILFYCIVQDVGMRQVIIDAGKEVRAIVEEVMTDE